MKNLAIRMKAELEAKEIEKYGHILTQEEREAEYQKEAAEEKMKESLKVKHSVLNSHLERVPPRYKEASFENFVGYKEKVEFLKKGESAILCGGNGTGKTHLGYASCRLLAEQGKYVKFVLAYRFFEDIKNSFENNDTGRVLKEYASYDYLVIDEIDKAYGSQLEFIHLYHLVNERYNHLKPTVLITNANKGDLVKQVGSSVIDRIISEGAIIEMDGENYRKRKGGV